MKKISVKNAVGMQLCHDITKVLPGNFKGPVFKRGHLIRPEDIEELLQIGKEHIYVWDENEGIIHEDEAAVRLGKAVTGPNMTWEGPAEGKVVIKSSGKGLFKVKNELCYEINSIGNITIACLPNNFTVENDQKLAGARIIPLVIEETKIEEIESLCKTKGPLLEIKPYRRLKTGIVITGNEIYKGRISDKFEPVIDKKLAYYDGIKLGTIFCPDESERIEAAIQQFIKMGAELIILTGGMSVDPDDLTPGAIRKVATNTETYGVPVQPGNMFMLAYYHNTTMIGVPGAALYYKTTILDVVLARVFAGETLTKNHFIRMSEGGFCSNCKECSYPFCYFCR